MVYTSIGQYLESSQSIIDKIAKLEIILSSMLSAYLRSMDSGEFEEYRYDDGHSKIDVIYRDPNALLDQIEKIRKLQKSFGSDISTNEHGRVMRGVDGKNFIYYGNYR